MMQTYFTVNFRNFVLLTVCFMLMTVIGTLTHEFGHYATAKFLGHDAGINYRSSWNTNPQQLHYLQNTYKRYSHELKNNLNFPEKETYDKVLQTYLNHHGWIVAGGPLQTMLTGCIGALGLIVFRKKLITPTSISPGGWCLIFLALFWLRQVANLVMAFATWLKNNQASQVGDEMRLTVYLNLPLWSIQLITGGIGCVVLGAVLYIMPKQFISTFILAGLIGGVTGFYCWFYLLGPWIMP